MRVTVAFDQYNEKRYGRPWIAVITSWPVGGKPEVSWGSYLGDARNGGGGETEIEANPGDIIRWGQKDNRGRNTEASWGILCDDGSITDCDAKTAKEYWVNKKNSTSAADLTQVNPLAGFSDEELLAEIYRRKLQ